MARLVEARDEASRADGKASIVLAAAGVALGILFAGFLAGDVEVTEVPGPVVVAGTLGIISAAVGLILIASVVFPQYGTPERGRARYYVEIAQYDDLDELKAAVVHDLRDDGDRLLRQISRLSKRVVRKYDLTRWGMCFLGMASALGSLAGVLNLVLD